MGEITGDLMEVGVGFTEMGTGVGVGAGTLTLFWAFSVENFFISSSEGRGTGVSISEGGITSETSVGITGMGGAGAVHAKAVIPHKLMIGIKPRARFISKNLPSS